MIFDVVGRDCGGANTGSIPSLTRIVVVHTQDHGCMSREGSCPSLSLCSFFSAIFPTLPAVALFPATMTTQLGFEDAAVLGFSIYKYRIPLLQKTHLSRMLLLFFIFISSCIVHLLLFLSFSLHPFYFLLLYNNFSGFYWVLTLLRVTC